MHLSSSPAFFRGKTVEMLVDFGNIPTNPHYDEGQFNMRLGDGSPTFYELAVFKDGRAHLRRVSHGMRYKVFASGKHQPGFAYAQPRQSQRFWFSYDSGTGRYRFGVGGVPGQDTVLDWTDPSPVALSRLGRFGANIYSRRPDVECGGGLKYTPATFIRVQPVCTATEQAMCGC